MEPFRGLGQLPRFGRFRTVSQPSSVKWESRSKVHRKKFEKLIRIPPDKIKMIGSTRVCFDNQFMIGKGCRGTTVYIGLLEDGSEVAVKRMLSTLCGPMAEKEKRLLTLSDLRMSEHIVNYRHCEYEDPFCYLVVDLCEMTLEEYVGSRSMEELRADGPKIIKELLTGLAALHNGKVKVLHMDLKPQNILVDAYGRMKLTDFGLSRELDEGETTLLTGEQGTTGWVAKESIVPADRKTEKVKFKRKSDVQTMGMICFFVLTKGEHPFGDRLDRMLNIRDGKPVNMGKLNDIGLAEARDLISWMLSSNIEERPYVEQALDHPYLKLSDDTDQQLLTVPAESRVTFSPTRIVHNPKMSSHVFLLSEAVYYELLQRSDLELQLRWYQVGDIPWSTRYHLVFYVSVNGTVLTNGRDVTSKQPLYLKQFCRPGENTIETFFPYSLFFDLELVSRLPVGKVIYKLLRQRLLLARDNATKIVAYFFEKGLYSMKLSLKCPMTQQRISIPARGQNCDHIQCFDLGSYLRRNAVEESWRCPVCKEQALCELLVVDQYMWRILMSLERTETEEITINSESEWTPMPVALGNFPEYHSIDAAQFVPPTFSIEQNQTQWAEIPNTNFPSPSQGTVTSNNQSSYQNYPSSPFFSPPYF